MVGARHLSAIRSIPGFPILFQRREMVSFDSDYSGGDGASPFFLLRLVVTPLLSRLTSGQKGPFCGESSGKDVLRTLANDRVRSRTCLCVSGRG